MGVGGYNNVRLLFSCKCDRNDPPAASDPELSLDPKLACPKLICWAEGVPISNAEVSGMGHRNFCMASVWPSVVIR